MDNSSSWYENLAMDAIRNARQHFEEFYLREAQVYATLAQAAAIAEADEHEAQRR